MRPFTEELISDVLMLVKGGKGSERLLLQPASAAAAIYSLQSVPPASSAPSRNDAVCRQGRTILDNGNNEVRDSRELRALAKVRFRHQHPACFVAGA